MKNKNLAFLIALGGVSFIMMIILFVLTIPDNPIKLRYSILAKNDISKLLPQGWAFFTKNPRDEEVYLYKIDTLKNTTRRVFLNSSRSSQLFGIKKTNRIINGKISSLIEEIMHEHWYYNEGNTLDFISATANLSCINMITKKVKEPAVCGLYCIESKKPIPWSWANIDQELNLPSKLILIDFKCY